jgi:hypothetical protein
VTELMIALHLRIYDALEDLRVARADGDEAGVAASAGEIEDLVEIAARHGVDLSAGYGALVPAA